MANVTVYGYVFKDAELRDTKSGDQILTFRMRERVYNRQKREAETQWWGVTLFGKRAQSLENIVKEGKFVVVQGELEAEVYKEQVSLRVKCNDIGISFEDRTDDERARAKAKRREKRRRDPDEEFDGRHDPDLDDDDDIPI
jgi:single-strand DNA-binding protein